ncbi:MAG: DUF1109 family protein [Proteobacteria bacterium]|nr:DUF1109 family protein [Pseudomonadota bacterium]
METEELIGRLAAGAGRPVRRLAPPSARLLFWLAVSLPWIAVVVTVMGVRPDLTARFEDPRWIVEQGAALVTAVAAALAAFCAGVPGRPRWERVVPIVPVVVWIGAVGFGCLQDWIRPGPGGVMFESDWACLPGIVFVGAAPGIAMAVMLHKGAPLAPFVSVGLGGLAAAALADFGLRLFHAQDAGLMVLVWQVGSVALLTVLSAAIGRHLVRWRHLPLH